MDQQDRIRLTRFVADLHRPLSQERLETYRAPNGSDLDMVVTYFWNIALSEALYPTILAFEVAIRNSIHFTLWRHYRTPYWFDRPGVLLPRELKAIADTRGYLRHGGKPRNDGRIIAALPFVFWVWMFNRPYEATIWQPDNKITVLRRAFPNLPTSFRSRTAVERRCDEIRALRNRIAHSEPIWNRPELNGEHLNIVRAVRWIRPPLETAVSKRDRFRDVFENGRLAIETDLREQIGLPSPTRQSIGQGHG